MIIIYSNWFSDIATWIIAITSIIATLVAWYQLSNLRNTLKINSLMTVLEIETEMPRRKDKIDEISFKIKELPIIAKGDPAQREARVILQGQLDITIENYLNSVDRLCFCILKEYLPDKDWRSEYKQYIANIVRDFESKLGPDSPYNNIKQLNVKWGRS